MAPQVIAWKPLGELLVERGLLTVADLDDALEEQARTGERLGAILVARKVVAGAVLTTLLAEQVGVELETQGGFGSGLFTKIATRNGSAEAEPAEPVAVTPSAGADESLSEAAAALDDPAYSLSALRAELEMLRAQNAQLEAEVAAFKAKPAAAKAKSAAAAAKPAAPRGRTSSKSSA
jgi:type IV pilus assembly protein PilB